MKAGRKKCGTVKDNDDRFVYVFRYRQIISLAFELTTNKIMGIAKERRLKKEVKRLTNLLEADVNLFLKVWNQRVTGWLLEMQSTARKLHTKNAEEANKIFGPENKCKEEKEPQTISGVLKRANELIKACGEKVESLVGNQTRGLLDAECAKLEAQIYEPRSYRMIAHRQYTLTGKRKTRSRVLTVRERI